MNAYDNDKLEIINKLGDMISRLDGSDKKEDWQQVLRDLTDVGRSVEKVLYIMLNEERQRQHVANH